MKTKLLILALAFLGGIQLFAQEEKVAVSLGVVGGADFSTISTVAPVNADMQMKPGFNAGAALNVRFLKRNARSTAKTGVLAFQPEVRYATMGAKVGTSGIKLDYLMVPVMLQVYPTKSFYIEAGPEFAYNISHSPDNLAADSYQVSMQNLKANDIMLGVGLGFRFGVFNIGARYNMGFSDMASNLPWRNNMLQVNLGFLFQFKKKALPVLDF
jgi:hypothetical protein